MERSSAVAGGAVDTVMMRIVDALYSLPTLFILILLSAIFSPNLPLMILVLSFIAWLGPARLVRGEALSLRTREYVQAVKVAGGTQSRIVVRHIIPNTIGTIMVNTSFLIADAILALAALSYLGLGLPDTTPTWGGMLSNGTNVIYDGYWWQLYPAGIRHRPDRRGVQLHRRRTSRQPRRPAAAPLKGRGPGALWGLGPAAQLFDPFLGVIIGKFLHQWRREAGSAPRKPASAALVHNPHARPHEAPKVMPVVRAAFWAR